MRSLLFVPGDSAPKLAKATDLGADALIIDLEDSVTLERKSVARSQAAEFLHGATDRTALWVRINSLRSGESALDLATIVPARPAGIVLPKIYGPEDLETLSDDVQALEVAHDLPIGAISLLCLATETPSSVLRMGELIGRTYPRLVGLSWGAEDLSAALGAANPRTLTGEWRFTYQYARTQCLLAAHALGVQAIDTVYVNFRDLDGLRQDCVAARLDGFTGCLAIHPDQVAVINELFAPTEADLAFARRLVAAFAGGAGTVSLDGRMYDAPHLRAAQRLLGAAAR